jgi:hypothetical protein
MKGKQEFILLPFFLLMTGKQFIHRFLISFLKGISYWKRSGLEAQFRAGGGLV